MSPSCFYDIVLINPVLQRSYLGCLSCCEFKQVTAKSFPEDSISHCSSLTLLILSFFLPLWRHFLHLGVSDMHFPFMAEHSMAIFFSVFRPVMNLSSHCWSLQEEVVSLIKVMARYSIVQMWLCGKLFPGAWGRHSLLHTIARCWGRLEEKKSKARTQRRNSPCRAASRCHHDPELPSQSKAKQAAEEML